MGANSDHVYQLLTDDEVELVLVQADTMDELAAETNIKVDTLKHALHRKQRVGYKGAKVRIIRVDLDDIDDEEKNQK